MRISDSPAQVSHLTKAWIAHPIFLHCLLGNALLGRVTCWRPHEVMDTVLQLLHDVHLHGHNTTDHVLVQRRSEHTILWSIAAAS